jgi:propanediol dehydratase small subunit
MLAKAPFVRRNTKTIVAALRHDRVDAPWLLDAPIEQVFAKLKHLLRKAAARSREAVCATIGEIHKAYAAEECQNYLRNAGYGST